MVSRRRRRETGRIPVVGNSVELSREVIAFQRATQRLVTMLTFLKNSLRQNETVLELRRDLRAVEDHAIRTVERIDGFRSLLQNALISHPTLIAQKQSDETRTLTKSSVRQNEQVKRISSWTTILFTPTLMETVYGTNFSNMPEFDSQWGYPFAVGLTIAMGAGLYAAFKGKGWR